MSQAHWSEVLDLRGTAISKLHGSFQILKWDSMESQCFKKMKCEPADVIGTVGLRRLSLMAVSAKSASKLRQDIWFFFGGKSIFKARVWNFAEIKARYFRA